MQTTIIMNGEPVTTLLGARIMSHHRGEEIAGLKRKHLCDIVEADISELTMRVPNAKIIESWCRHFEEKKTPCIVTAGIRKPEIRTIWVRRVAYELP